MGNSFVLLWFLPKYYSFSSKYPPPQLLQHILNRKQLGYALIFSLLIVFIKPMSTLIREDQNVVLVLFYLFLLLGLGELPVFRFSEIALLIFEFVGELASL